jgi:hypothetical protein
MHVPVYSNALGLGRDVETELTNIAVTAGKLTHNDAQKYENSCRHLSLCPLPLLPPRTHFPAPTLALLCLTLHRRLNMLLHRWVASLKAAGKYKEDLFSLVAT